MREIDPPEVVESHPGWPGALNRRNHTKRETLPNEGVVTVRNNRQEVPHDYTRPIDVR